MGRGSDQLQRRQKAARTTRWKIVWARRPVVAFKGVKRQASRRVSWELTAQVVPFSRHPAKHVSPFFMEGCSARVGDERRCAGGSYFGKITGAGIGVPTNPWKTPISCGRRRPGWPGPRHWLAGPHVCATWHTASGGHTLAVLDQAGRAILDLRRLLQGSAKLLSCDLLQAIWPSKAPSSPKSPRVPGSPTCQPTTSTPLL